MSFLRGLIAGVVITALQIAAGHASLDFQRLSFHGNTSVAAAVPVILLPLAIAWGWTWVSDRWAGRSGPRLLLFTAGLVLGAAAGFPLDYVLFPPSGDLNIGMVADLVLLGMIFVLPVVALAAILYWAYASGKASASFGPLALSYIGALFLSLLLPTLTMGAVAGTAAGHSWHKPGARGAIGFLVILLMLVGAFELPMAAAQPLP